MAGIKRIALLLDYNDNYAKTVVDGVARYSVQSRWRFVTHRGVPSVSFEELKEKPADGVIGYLTPSMVTWLKRRGIPAVNVKTDFPKLPACSVLTDNRKIGRLAADYYAGKGFCRFAYVAEPVTGVCAQLKYEGFSGRLKEIGFDCFRLKVNETAGQFRTDAKISLAVFAVEDFVGRMVIDHCEDSGLRVPEDVAVLGVNNSPFVCSMVRPQMSSIELGAERIGYRAAQLLDRLMRGMSPPDEPVVIAPEEIIERRSTELVQSEGRIIPAALRFIREHVQEPVQVEDIARAAGCGRRMLEKVFRQELKRSPHEEIRRARIRRACELLRQTDTIIEVIAGQCGYATRDRFNAAFRAEQGMVPSQYRRQYRFAKYS